MKKVYGYIRVSTVKQGEGVSLEEQEGAIIRYAEKHNLKIIEWFEEKETAAKQGRPLFNQMMKLVKDRKSDGVIIHKIDRSARNLKDWVAIGELIDQGLEVHFAHESLDMDTRGGRLAADIQAVIASDYIRNLSQEASKGLYGRLKQGLYPFYAPIGYINNGKGKVKTIDPVQGPLVKKAFELYASKPYSLDNLVIVMQELGLRNTKGNFVTKAAMSLILNNPFYAGVLKVKGRTFPGKHEPLIASELFKQVQNILRGKTNTKQMKHDFLFRKLIKCAECNYSMIGEKQKGHVYYRCHSKECPTTGVREELIEKAMLKSFEGIQLHPVEDHVLNELVEESQQNWAQTQNGLEESYKMQKQKLSLKFNKLTDAYFDDIIEKDALNEKKEALLVEQQGLDQKISQLSSQKEIIFKKAEFFLEFLKNLKKSYENGIFEERVRIIKIITSNLTIQGKKLMITMKLPFNDITNRWNFSSCGHDRNRSRICTAENANTEYYTPFPVDNQELRERMKDLLDLILKHCESVELDEELIIEENNND
ncbi:MAG: recombinase family protein [Saprospiraceae bacterium]|jgi:DNA invertase Pin-like site-specific DNA recombinase